MEKFYPSGGQPTYGTLVVTDNKWKQFRSGHDVPANVMKSQFDYLSEEDTYDGFLNYQGFWYHTSQFERINLPYFQGDWDGVHHTSQSTGAVIKLSKDAEEYKIGSYRTVSEQSYQAQRSLKKNPDEDEPLTETEKGFAARNYAKKFGLSAAEARELVESGRVTSINDAVHDWAMSKGVATNSSLARGKLLELLRGGSRMTRNATKDLRRLTPRQVASAIDRLSKLSLSELRRRQNLVASQRKAAYQRGQEDSMSNLDIMERHLIAAIDKKEFARNGRLGLERIKVLFRLPDTLALYGIPYELRPGQSPKDLHGQYRTDWIFLGYPGWYGPIPDADAEEIKEFLVQHEGNIPQNPYDFTRIDTTEQLPAVDIGDGQEMLVRISNPIDADSGNLFYFSFGAYGNVHVLVWGRSVEVALEEAAGYLRDQGLDGIFVSDESMQSLVREVEEELGPGASDEEVHDKATVDLTYTEAGYIPSYEWWVDDVSDPKLIAAAKNASERYTEAF